MGCPQGPSCFVLHRAQLSTVPTSYRIYNPSLVAVAMALRVHRCTVDDWSNLSSDVLDQISKRLAIEDYIRVQAVCKSWRLALNQRPFLHNPPDQLPWLAIPDNTSSICKFYNLKEDKFYHIYLPELHDAVCIGSSHGWMIVVDRSLNVFLLNPLTRSRIQLPPIPTCSGHRMWFRTAEQLQYVFFKKVILSSNPSLTGDYIAMAICGSNGRLAFCRQGDDKWTFMDDGYRDYRDLVYWKQKYFVLHARLSLFVCDMGGKVSEVIPVPDITYGVPSAYLVISEEQLLLVCYEGCSIPKIDEFTVYVLDEERRNWVRFTNLEGCMLFLGNNFSSSLGADEFPEWKGNCIYFAADQLEGDAHIIGSTDLMISGYDMGCYSLRARRLEPLGSFGLRQSGLKLLAARLIEFCICNLFQP